jgi:hypothetical protein
MAYEADRVVVELLAKTDELDAPIKQSATNFDASMNKIASSATKAEAVVTGAHKRMSLAANNNRIALLEMQHVVRGSVDQFAAGAPVSQIFAQHIASVGQAAALSGGALGTFGAILSGPVGLALTATTAIAALFIGKLLSTADATEEAVKKLKEHAEKLHTDEEAQRIFNRTVEGSIAVIHDLTEEIAKQNLTLEDNINLKKAAISAGLQNVLSNIGSTSGDLAAAITELHDARRLLLDLQSGASPLGENAGAAITAAQTRFDAARQKVLDLSNQLHLLNKSAGDAGTALKSVDFPLIEQRAKDAVDPIAQINHHFDDLAAKAKNAGTYTQAFADALEKQRHAALEAEKANKRLGEGLGGVQIGFAEASRIARAAGFTVTSAQRSTARQAALFNDPTVNRPGNPVARPGTSAHEGVNGRWALDIAFEPGLTPQKLRKVFGAEGVSLSVVKKEAGHFHIEGSRSEAASQEREAQRQIEEERRREQAFQNEKAQAEADVLDARKSLAVTAEDIAAIETASVDAARQHTNEQIAAAQAAGKLLPQEAVELVKINEERAKYRQQLVDLRLRQAQFARTEENFARGRDFQTASYQAEAEVLQSQEALARTATQRRNIEQRLIDLQFAEERLKNQYVIDWAERVKANKDATDKEKADAALAEQIAQLHQQSLPERQANATAGNAQANASPLQDFFNSIPQTAADINDAFEHIAANGLSTFNDALASAIVNFTSLSDVARTVLGQLATDLIKFALQQIELHTIGAALGAASVASTTAFAAAAGAAWAGPAALASLATLGTNAGPAAAAIASTVGLATVLGAAKAGGGRIFGSGSDTSDNILTPMSPGEFAIKASSARNIGYDTLDYINRHGSLPAGISPSNGIAATPGGRGGFSSSDLGQLRGIVSEAIRAMPDVSLYASLDPVEVLQRALGTPTGSRALIAHLGNNATAVKASLNRP